MHRKENYSKKSSYNHQGHEQRSFGGDRTNFGFGQGRERPQTAFDHQQAPFKKVNPNQRRFEGGYDDESDWNQNSYRTSKYKNDKFSTFGPKKGNAAPSKYADNREGRGHAGGMKRGHFASKG